ncbi:MAG: type II toxin-antitoxin system Phd/YefM family antitoxin [Kiritimatiellia bacterium]
MLIRQAQHNLAAYVRRVEQGEMIEIRRRNRVVARLVSVEPPARPAPVHNWGELRAWRRKIWGTKPVTGKPASGVVYESRGDR